MSTIKKPRDSRVRNVFGTAAKSQEHYNGIKYQSPSADANPLIANKKFFAFPWRAKGVVTIVDLKSVGAVPDDAPMLEQEETVTDLAFNPFDDNALAIAGEQNITFWKFNDEIQHGIKPAHVLENPHEKRLQNIFWHPAAQNVFLTTAVDKLVKIWDVEHGAQEKLSIPGHEGFVTSMTWNEEASLMATTAKDKMLRIIDPRAKSIVSEAICHEGAKASRAVWLGRRNQILTVGFKKGAPEREMALWDPRNLSSRLCSYKIDAIPSSMFPFYDPDLSLLYIVGKGDGNIRMFEVVDGAEPLQEVGEFRSSVSQAGFAFLPKLSNDVMKCEVGKFLKLQDNTVVPIRFEITRQNSGYMFQQDLYPDTWDCLPSYTASEWFNGDIKQPNLVKVSPP